MDQVMASLFGWLDHSERDRRRMLEVVDLFRETDILDELGIGSVRDAFANLLFPGLSTIQTRARYFLFIPWVYEDLERRHVSSAAIRRRAREAEVALIEALVTGGEGRNDGVIGIASRQALKRLPSTIYWLGLRTFGIRLFHGSIEQYHRSLDGFHRQARTVLRTDDGEPVDGPVPGNWHAGLPPMPDDLLSRATFRLTPGEAEYLEERILASVPRSLLAFLVGQRRPVEGSAFPWELGQLPGELGMQVRHARNFSEAMHGASLLYNLLLAERAGEDELMEEYRDRIGTWRTLLQTREAELEEWDRSAFWELVLGTRARVPSPARQFISEWLRIALASAGNVADAEPARQLIRERELRLKGKQARLFNQDALDRWNGYAGVRQLEFRWSNAVRILEDIRAGLRGESVEAADARA